LVEYDLREAVPSDTLAISILLETSFESGTEDRLIKDLRAEKALELELVAVEAGHVIGHAAFPRLARPRGWFGLAPLTVRADRREMGVGSTLVRVGIDRLRQAKAPALLVLGDPGYYERFGFSLRAAAGLRSAYPKNNLMMLPFAPGLAGQPFDVDYPPVFLRN
jgi:putative acetyltransferase